MITSQIYETKTDKMTPKQCAKELILDKLELIQGCYWITEDSKLTDREVELVQEQVGKIVDRIIKKYL